MKTGLEVSGWYEFIVLMGLVKALHCLIKTSLQVENLTTKVIGIILNSQALDVWMSGSDIGCLNTSPTPFISELKSALLSDGYLNIFVFPTDDAREFRSKCSILPYNISILSLKVLFFLFKSCPFFHHIIVPRGHEIYTVLNFSILGLDY